MNISGNYNNFRKVDCKNNCKTCEIDLETCSSCNKSLYLKDQACLEKCPKGHSTDE